MEKIIMNHLSFLLIILPILLCPGPMTLTIASISSTYGFSKAFFSICGGSIAYFFQLILVTLGVDAVLTRVPSIIDVIKIMGMSYLFYLAWKASKKSLSIKQDIKIENASPLKLLQQGLIVGITNPKSLVIFSVIFPQFLTPASSVAHQLMQLMAVFLAAQFVTASLYALMAKSIFSRFAAYDDKRINVNSVGLTFAGFMIGLT